jgi:hypothetical protein
MQIQNFPSGTPLSNDLILFQSSTDESYRKAMISRLPSSSAGSSDWQLINANYTALANTKIFNFATSDITLTLPSSVTPGQEIEIHNFTSTSKISINLQGNKYLGASYQSSNLVCQGDDKRVHLLYINDSNGWYPITGNLDILGVFVSSAALLLEGSLIDTSGNNRTVSLIGNAPSIITGLDNRPTLRFSGASNQELSVNPFLSGTSGATLYIVFTPNDDQYNLIKTGNMDDYWRFSGNAAGYFGTFRNARYEAYPLNMPTSGSHLISIHASGSNYEVFQNNVSKGSRTDSAYTPGDRFRIASDDKRYTGDISLLLVYSRYLAPTSNSHLINVQTIKSKFPSLPFTL